MLQHRHGTIVIIELKTKRKHDIGHTVRPIFCLSLGLKTTVVPPYYLNELGFQYYNYNEYL